MKWRCETITNFKIECRIWYFRSEYLWIWIYMLLRKELKIHADLCELFYSFFCYEKNWKRTWSLKMGEIVERMCKFRKENENERESWRDAKAIKLKERMKKVKREQHSDQNRAEWSESCWTSKEKSWKCLKGRRQRPSIFTRKKNSLRTELASAAFWSDFNPFSLL